MTAVRPLDEWAELAEAVLTHDLSREQHAWHELSPTCAQEATLDSPPAALPLRRVGESPKS